MAPTTAPPHRTAPITTTGVWGRVGSLGCGRCTACAVFPRAAPMPATMRARADQKLQKSNAEQCTHPVQKNDGPVRRSAKHKSQLRPCTPLSFKSSPHVEKSFNAVAKTKHKCSNSDKHLKKTMRFRCGVSLTAAGKWPQASTAPAPVDSMSMPRRPGIADAARDSRGPELQTHNPKLVFCFGGGMSTAE